MIIMIMMRPIIITITITITITIPITVTVAIAIATTIYYYHCHYILLSLALVLVWIFVLLLLFIIIIYIHIYLWLIASSFASHLCQLLGWFQALCCPPCTQEASVGWWRLMGRQFLACWLASGPSSSLVMDWNLNRPYFKVAHDYHLHLLYQIVQSHLAKSVMI